MDIDEFITARLDDREHVALLAGEGHWRLDDPDGCTPCRIDGDDMIIYDESGHSREQAGHIVLNDPAHVLREVAAKRKILAEYMTALQLPDAVFAGTEREAGFLLALEMACRAFAAVDDGHPDYDPKWRLK